MEKVQKTRVTDPNTLKVGWKVTKDHGKPTEEALTITETYSNYAIAKGKRSGTVVLTEARLAEMDIQKAD